MFESARKAIGFQIASFRLRKSTEHIVSFCGAVTKSERALLILPFHYHETVSTNVVISLLKNHFRDEDITVVTDSHALEPAQMLPRAQFIHVLDTEITPFFLPRANLMARITKKSYDLALDLNLDLVLPSAYICRESNARVRIGFLRKQSELFYNFQIQPDLSLSRKLIYDRVAHCLAMF